MRLIKGRGHPFTPPPNVGAPAAPANPILYGLLHLVTNDATPDISWDAATGSPTSYEIEVGDTLIGTPTTTGITDLVTTAPTQAEGNRKAKVRSRNAVGASAWSTELDFIVSLDFADDFNRANGTPGNGWIGNSIAISGNKLIITPATGIETVVNGTFNTDISGWTDASVGTGDIAWNATGKMDVIAGSGSNFGIARQTLTLVPGKLYRVSDSHPSGLIRYSIGTTPGASDMWNPGSLGGSFSKVFLATQATAYLQISNQTPSTTITIDNVSVKQLSSMVAVREEYTPYGAVSAQATKSVSSDNNMIGVVHYADEDNWVAGLLSSRDNLVLLYKCVAGVISQPIAQGAVTYTAGLAVTLTHYSDGRYSVGYDGNTIIAATLIPDAVFLTATKFGPMLTYQVDTIDNATWFAEVS